VDWILASVGKGFEQLFAQGPVGLLCFFLLIGMVGVCLVVRVLWNELKLERAAHSATKDLRALDLTSSLNVVNEIRTVFEAFEQRVISRDDDRRGGRR